MTNPTTIEATYVAETPNAFLLDCEGDEIWFPKAKIEFNKEKEELTAPLWLLKEKFPGEF